MFSSIREGNDYHSLSCHVITFCWQTPLNATLRGITNDDIDATIDTLRTSVLSLMTRFGVSVEEGLNIL